MQDVALAQLVSIRAPRAGGDLDAAASIPAPSSFQSAPPARGATRFSILTCGFKMFQSAPPARGATSLRVTWFWFKTVSIRAPRAGGDAGLRRLLEMTAPFQSAPPARGATASAAVALT